MAEVRTCVYTLVLLVLLQRTVASPTFGSALLCSVFCVDDYEEDSRSSSIEDYLTSWLFGGDDDDDSSESDAKPSTEKPAAGDGKPQKINLSIPPANGVNLTLENSGTWWWLNLVPWVGGSSATTGAPTTAAPATTAAANGTAASTTAAA